MNDRVQSRGTQALGNQAAGIAASHYQIPTEPGRNSAFILAGLMHVLLILFLWIGIRWQSSEPVGVDAEIWDLNTRQAAPSPSVEVPPPPPPPPPEEVQKADPQPSLKQLKQIELEREAEIVTERAREKKINEKKLLEEKIKEDKLKEEKIKEDKLKEAKIKEDKEDQKRKENDQKKQDLAKAAEQKKTDALAQLAQKQRDDNLKRLTKQVAGTGGTGDAVKSTGNNRVDASYAGKIAAKIKSNMVYVGADNGSDNPTVEFRVDLFPDGSIRGAPQKTKSSGVAAFDDAVEKAITKSAPYPADKSGNVPSTIPLTYRLKD